MSSKYKGDLFICQITDACLKLIKCASAGSGRRTKFVSLAAEVIPVSGGDKVKDSLSAALKSLGYNNNPLVLSLPRQNVTLRYLKIPAHSPQEIENIISLQAPRFLPYPAEELITAYQVVSVDREGYSHLNLVIAHKDIIERYLGLFKALGVRDVNVVLSSFGLVNFFNQAERPQGAPIMFVDIEMPVVEVAVIFEQKLYFSRSFKLAATEADPAARLSEEINKSIDSYIKETQGVRPEKVIVCGSLIHATSLTEGLRGGLSLPVEDLSYEGNIASSANFLNEVNSSEFSFVSLIGLGLQEIPESFSLLPRQIKSTLKSALKRREVLRYFVLAASALVVFMLGFSRSMDNKRKCLERLNLELKKVAGEASPLEKIEKRSKLIESRSQKNISGIDVLYEVYKIIPQGVSLTNFTYEEQGSILLRGQTADLNSVFDFTAKLDEDKTFNGFKAKVRYATKKKLQSGEFVDFEIAIQRKGR